MRKLFIVLTVSALLMLSTVATAFAGAPPPNIPPPDCTGGVPGATPPDCDPDVRGDPGHD